MTGLVDIFFLGGGGGGGGVGMSQALRGQIGVVGPPFSYYFFLFDVDSCYCTNPLSLGSSMLLLMQLRPDWKSKKIHISLFNL